mmetsp:Transcript_3355/g.7976  ORF Transcript_3355/g.7976 Transcript_3355/m.7976 type:complete len:128 (+) Transcript_3355:191-574(+)
MVTKTVHSVATIEIQSLLRPFINLRDEGQHEDYDTCSRGCVCCWISWKSLAYCRRRFIGYRDWQRRIGILAKEGDHSKVLQSCFNGSFPTFVVVNCNIYIRFHLCNHTNHFTLDPRPRAGNAPEGST